MMWRGLLAVVVLGFGGGHFVVASTKTSPTKLSVTVRFQAWEDNKAQGIVMDHLLANYERHHKGVTIAYTPLDGDSEDQLEQEFNAGTAPDVFEVDMGWVQDFIQAGVVQRLEGYASRDKKFGPSDFYSNLVRGFSAKGRTYAYPLSYTTLAIWYNKLLLNADHYKTFPNNWTSFSRFVCRATAKGVVGASLSTDASRWFGFIGAFGGKVLNSKGTAPAIASKQDDQALQWYDGLIKRGCAEATPTDGSDAQELADGHVAMTIEPSTIGPELSSLAPSLGTGIAPLPNGPKGPGNLAFATGYAMNIHSGHKTAAWELISFLESPSSMRSLDAASNVVPGRSLVKAKKGLSVFVNGFSHATPWAWPSGLVFNAFPHVGDDIRSASTGNETYQAAVSDMGVWIKMYL